MYGCRSLVALVAVSMAAASVSAGEVKAAGFIGVYSDPGFSNCFLYDALPPNTREFYIAVKQDPAVTAVRFRLEFSAGFACSFISESPAFSATQGDTRAGVYVDFESCQASDVLVYTINVFCSGTSTPCSFAQIAEHPAAATGAVELINCSWVTSASYGEPLYVNPDGGCVCGQIPATHHSTWGTIKSLYR